MISLALEITNGPMNVTVCSGAKAKISCGFTGVSAHFNVMPSWRIIKRDNNGSVISNETVSGIDIHSNNVDDLQFTTVINHEGSADKSYLSVGPVDIVTTTHHISVYLPLTILSLRVILLELLLLLVCWYMCITICRCTLLVHLDCLNVYQILSYSGVASLDLILGHTSFYFTPCLTISTV